MSLTTLLAHTSDEWIEATFSMPVEKSTAHGYGSCLTYLRRYTLNALVGIVSSLDVTDDDGNAASGVTTPAPRTDILVEPKGYQKFLKELFPLVVVSNDATTEPYPKESKAKLLAFYRAAPAECRAYLAQNKPQTHSAITKQATEKTT